MSFMYSGLKKLKFELAALKIIESRHAKFID